MGRKEQVKRSAEEKWEILQEGVERGNIAENCPKHGGAPKLRGSGADRRYDQQIIAACGEKPTFGYRRVTLRLQRQQGLPVNHKRVLRVMRERGLLVLPRRLRARRRKEWGRVEASAPNQIWQSDMTKVWAGPAVGWAYLVEGIG